MKSLILALLFFPSLVEARVCEVAYYGIQHPGWPCEASIRALDSCTEIKVAFLAHTFGDYDICLSRILADPRTNAVEIHLINERCSERPGGCAPYEFMYGLTIPQFNTLLKRRDPWIMNKVGHYFTEQAGKFWPLLKPQTVCWISPVLESKLEPAAFQTLAEIAHWQFLQRCNIVYNPLKNTGTIGYIYEIHGDAPRLNPPCITDLDGVDIKLDLQNNSEERNRAFYSGMISESGARQYLANYRKCGAAYLWVHEFNLRSKRFEDPRLRTNTATPEIFNRVISLFPN